MKYLIPFAALAALLPLVPGLAAPARTQLVSYDDLDLASSDGRAKLDRRIRHAADEVCGVPSQFDLVGQNNAGRCRTATAAAASRTLAQALPLRRVITVVADNR